MTRSVSCVIIVLWLAAVPVAGDDLPEAWVVNALASQPYAVCYLKIPQEHRYSVLDPPQRLFLPARFSHGSRDTTVLLTSSITANNLTFLYYVPLGSRPDSMRVNSARDSIAYLYMTDSPPAPGYPAAQTVRQFLENYDSIAVRYYGLQSRLQDYHDDGRYWDWALFSGAAVIAVYGFAQKTDAGNVAGYVGSGLAVGFGIAAIRNLFIHRTLRKRSDEYLDQIRRWSFPHDR